jgi:hypothetical protein
MQHVPLKDRLTCCCLVSRRLHTAAVAAADALYLNWTSGTERMQWRIDTVGQWFSLYGQHLTSLVVDSPVGRWPLLQQLPCQKLLELQLSYCSVQLGAADGQKGVIHGCTKLTRLVLCCNIIDAPVGTVVDSLSSLVHVQHLCVHGRVPGDGGGLDSWGGYLIGGLSDVTLPRLKHLTYLRVHGLNDQNLLQLQHLTSLSALVMNHHPPFAAVGPSSVPGLVFPASLKTLISWSSMEAGILSVLPTGMQELRLEVGVDGPADGPGSLLSCMPRLQHLTWLLLQAGNSLAWPPPGPAYSAITASSNLVTLELYDCNCPDGAWSYVFPAAHKLPHLTCLKLLIVEDDDHPVDMPSPASCAVDVSSLVSCCPSLREIWGLSLQHGLHVSVLHQLTSLQRLDAYFDHAESSTVEESLKALSAVTQAWLLSVTVDIEDLPKSALLPLTKLTNLGLLKLKTALLMMTATLSSSPCSL